VERVGGCAVGRGEEARCGSRRTDFVVVSRDALAVQPWRPEGAETGAAGPTGNRYGDAAGHSCMAVAGPATEVMTLETASNDRFANMQVFAATALRLLLKKLEG